MKFKLDENLDVRLATTMHEKGLDGDAVLSEALSGASESNEESIEGRLWIVEPGKVRVYVPENDDQEE